VGSPEGGPPEDVNELEHVPNLRRTHEENP